MKNINLCPQGGLTQAKNVISMSLMTVFIYMISVTKITYLQQETNPLNLLSSIPETYDLSLLPMVTQCIFRGQQRFLSNASRAGSLVTICENCSATQTEIHFWITELLLIFLVTN